MGQGKAQWIEILSKAELLQEGIFIQALIPSLRNCINKKKVGNRINEAHYIISILKVKWALRRGFVLTKTMS